MITTFNNAQVLPLRWVPRTNIRALVINTIQFMSTTPSLTGNFITTAQQAAMPQGAFRLALTPEMSFDSLVGIGSTIAGNKLIRTQLSEQHEVRRRGAEMLTHRGQSWSYFPRFSKRLTVVMKLAVAIRAMNENIKMKERRKIFDGTRNFWYGQILQKCCLQ